MRLPNFTHKKMFLLQQIFLVKLLKIKVMF